MTNTSALGMATAFSDCHVDHGTLHWVRSQHARGYRYLLYIPPGASTDTPAVVAVHGVSRNAVQMARRFQPAAVSKGFILIVPYFGRRRYPDYQRLNRSGHGKRADVALNRILDDVSFRLGRPLGRIRLFGYSGGAQFVHRYALVHHNRVAVMVLGASGWYTMPNPAYDYPLGVGKPIGLKSAHFDLDAYLQIPSMVVVGEQDVEQDKELRLLATLNLFQGMNRVERAQRWVKEMQLAACVRGYRSQHKLVLIPYAKHDFEDCIQAPGILTKIVDFLLHPGAPLQ